MARERNRQTKSQRGHNEALLSARSSLKELRQLCAGYDMGNYLSARTISVVVCRLVFEELPSLREPLRIQWVSYLDPITQNSANNVYGMVTLGIETTSPIRKITFLSTPNDTNDLAPRMERLSAWKKGIVFVEGSIAYRERLGKKSNIKKKPIIVSREKILKDTRNETGAHFDKNSSFQWFYGDGNDPAIDWASVTPDGQMVTYRDNPEWFDLANGPRDAVIRAISEEVIQTLQGKL